VGSSDILNALKHVDMQIEADVGDSYTLTRVKNSGFKAGGVFRAHLKVSDRRMVNQHLIRMISVHMRRNCWRELSMHGFAQYAVMLILNTSNKMI
jgi:hypothetical protein